MIAIFKAVLFFALLLMWFPDAHSQNFFRIKADFSVKETLPEGKSRLVMGKVYYDKNYRKIIYDISFPEKEIIVISDSVLTKISDGKSIQKTKVPSTNDFSVFHLCLNGSLSDFGLKSSPYKIETVEKDSGMVITTWIPPPAFAGKLGKVMVSQKEKKLFGIVFFNSKNEVVGKQFFKNYAAVKGLMFPGEIIHITFAGEEEFYKVTTFRNVSVDEMRDENIYNFIAPE